MDEHTTENLEHESMNQIFKEEPQKYTPRPKSQIILAWVLIGVVLFAFFGTCYWMVNGGV